MDQNQQNVLLTIIQYESSADQTFLTLNSLEIYGYFEDPETDIHAMISIVTPEQKTILLSKGYYVQTVEENPDLTNYTFYENNTPDQGRYLSTLGDVYVITKNHTLVRKNTKQHITSIPPSGFNEIPLQNMRPAVAAQNNVDVSEVIDLNKYEGTVTPPAVQNSNPSADDILSPVIVFIGLLLVFSIGLIIWKKLRKNSSTDIIEPPIS